MMNNDIDDIIYIILWGVSLDLNCNVIGVEIGSVIDLKDTREDDSSMFIDFQPSELFMERAKAQIKRMDWRGHKIKTTAHSYLYQKNPDRPETSNDNFR